MTPADFQQRLLDWFDRHGRRHLPWQQTITPYRVWVSEIMLQQTQVATVIPYFERFMQRFPRVETLAAASEDEVLQHWSGLGYYARARHLHRAAQQVVEQHDGEFPRTLTALAALPGVGRSTAGAIASISMNIPAPILDGNVKRVLTRLHAVEGWPGQPAVAERLWQLAEHYTPDTRTGDFTQALMDLGATLCTRRNPACGICPFSDRCAAHRQGRPTAFPQSKPARPLPEKTCWMLMLHCGEELLLTKRPAKGIWGGLWSLPEFASADDIAAALAGPIQVEQWQAWPAFRHTFSHYHLDIHPVQVRIDRRPAVDSPLVAGAGQVWYNGQQMRDLGLPAPVRRLIHPLLQGTP